jgi:hypothetical protein
MRRYITSLCDNIYYVRGFYFKEVGKMKVLIATKNKIKIAKIGTVLKEKGIEYITLRDLEEEYDVREDGDTTLENATLKARFYHELTGNPVEIHYALIKGVNDSIMDAEILANLIANRNIPVKFLLYNEKESIDYHPSNYSQYLLFQKILNNKNINVEYYAPNGIDIGASCGQILADYYLKYNLKESLKG